jgi:bacterioferritin (cytochrome b1)
MADHSLTFDVQTMRERACYDTEDGADLVAERVALESYCELVNVLGVSEAWRQFESILATEEKEHSEDLLSLIEDFGCRPPR